MLVSVQNATRRRRQRRGKLQRRMTKRWLLGLRPRRRYRLWLLLAFALLVGTLASVGALGVAVAVGYGRLTADLPSPDRVVQRDVFKTTTIYDRNGAVLYELWDPRAG